MPLDVVREPVLGPILQGPDADVPAPPPPPPPPVSPTPLLWISGEIARARNFISHMDVTFYGYLALVLAATGVIWFLAKSIKPYRGPAEQQDSGSGLGFFVRGGGNG